MSTLGQERPKADGYPLAPLIEAVIDVQFAQPLADVELERSRDALKDSYPTFTPTPFHQFRIDAEAGSAEILAVRTHYQGQGEDTAELCIVRPEGLATSQLAPYRDWASLYRRFARDLEVIQGVVGVRPLSRMAVRSLNRIDVPPTGNIIRYEDYITVHPNLPPRLDPIDDFEVKLLRSIPDIAALARITVKGHPQAVAERFSFVVDIDLFRTQDIPTEPPELEELFLTFRAAKNDLYRTCLTPLALKDFDA